MKLSKSPLKKTTIGLWRKWNEMRRNNAIWISKTEHHLNVRFKINETDTRLISRIFEGNFLTWFQNLAACCPVPLPLEEEHCNHNQGQSVLMISRAGIVIVALALTQCIKNWVHEMYCKCCWCHLTVETYRSNYKCLPSCGKFFRVML